MDELAQVAANLRSEAANLRNPRVNLRNPKMNLRNPGANLRSWDANLRTPVLKRLVIQHCGAARNGCIPSFPRSATMAKPPYYSAPMRRLGLRLRRFDLQSRRFAGLPRRFTHRPRRFDPRPCGRAGRAGRSASVRRARPPTARRSPLIYPCPCACGPGRSRPPPDEGSSSPGCRACAWPRRSDRSGSGGWRAAR